MYFFLSIFYRLLDFRLYRMSAYLFFYTLLETEEGEPEEKAVQVLTH